MTALLKHILQLGILWVVMAEFAFAGEGAEPREGGLTGTGIVGEITQLGSIVVNGHRITFEPGLPVNSVLGEKSARDLVPGEVVAVAVAPDGNDWSAEAIAQVHPIVGPISAIENGALTVLGVTVIPPENTSGLAKGDWIAVSGFWVRGAISATRIDVVQGRDIISVQGSYRQAGDGTTSQIGGLQLGVEALQHAKDGDVVRATGHLDGNTIRLTDIHLGLFDTPVSLVLAEGYFSDVAPSGHYTVSGSGLSSYTDNTAAQMPEGRIAVCGLGGRLLADGETPEAISPDDLRGLGCPNR